MSTGKFNNTYRIASARAQWWDYSSNAAYFITICTHNRLHFFGKIISNNMQLSQMGNFAQSCWFQIPNHFPFVQLGAFVVMPNHIHGIIIINKSNDGTPNLSSQNLLPPMVETLNFASLPPPPQQQQQQQQTNKFGPQSQNLASIVRGYKIGVTKHSKNTNPDFKWQARYHDHIIRNDAEYQRINDYIETNPLKWENDKFFK